MFQTYEFFYIKDRHVFIDVFIFLNKEDIKNKKINLLHFIDQDKITNHLHNFQYLIEWVALKKRSYTNTITDVEDRINIIFTAKLTLPSFSRIPRVFFLNSYHFSVRAWV